MKFQEFELVSDRRLHQGSSDITQMCLDAIVWNVVIVAAERARQVHSYLQSEESLLGYCHREFLNTGVLIMVPSGVRMGIKRIPQDVNNGLL